MASDSLGLSDFPWEEDKGLPRLQFGVAGTCAGISQPNCCGKETEKGLSHFAAGKVTAAVVTRSARCEKRRVKGTVGERG